YGRVIYFDDEGTSERFYMPQLTVHPSAREMGLEEVIAGRLVEMARSGEAHSGPARAWKAYVQVYLHEDDITQRTIWEELGLKELRRYWKMARSLDEPIDEPEPIEGTNIRPYRRPEDNRSAL